MAKKFHFTKKNTALLVIDMQEYFRGVASPIISNVHELMHESQKVGLPIFMTQHGHKDIHKDGGSLARWWGTAPGDYVQYGSKGWHLLPELNAPQQELSSLKDGVYEEKHGIRVVHDKSRYDAFEGTKLLTYLRENNIEHVIISGVLTNLCCETTARSAFVKDFNVIFLSDGTGTATQEMHQATLLNLGYGFASIMTCKDVIAKVCT